MYVSKTQWNKKILKFGIIYILFVECGQRGTDRKIYTLNP